MVTYFCYQVCNTIYLVFYQGYFNLLTFSNPLIPGDEKYDQFHTKNNHFVEVDGDVLSIRSKIMNRIEYQPTYHPALQRNVVIQNYPPLTPEISFTSMKTKL